MYIILLIGLIILNVPIYKSILKFAYPKKQDLNKALQYSVTPDFISLLRGEYLQDWAAEKTLQLVITVSAAVVGLEFTFIYLAVKIFQAYH
jgi:hypothetical protein